MKSDILSDGIADGMLWGITLITGIETDPNNFLIQIINELKTTANPQTTNSLAPLIIIASIAFSLIPLFDFIGKISNENDREQATILYITGITAGLFLMIITLI